VSLANQNVVQLSATLFCYLVL